MGEGKRGNIVTIREGGRQTQETLKYREQTEGGCGGGGKGKMGIEEGTWDEHWVLYVSDESWESKIGRAHV